MEIFDLYDINRVKVNETMIRGDKNPKDRYRTVVHLAIFNSQGKMLIQQRQKDKTGWPNMWDVSVGGSPISGDTSIEAIQRETEEELGLEIDFSGIRPAITFTFPEGFDDFYIINRDIALDEVKMQEEEVQSVAYATKEEIFTMIDEGKFISYSKDFISLLFYLGNGGRIIRR